MKRYVSVILLLLTILTLASCGADADLSVPDGMVEISNDNVNYDLYVPDDWTPETSTGVVTAKYSDSILVNVSMMAVTAPAEVSNAADYWAQFEDDFAATITDFEIIEENAAVLLDGHEASRYVYKGTIAGSVSTQYQQLICVKEGVIYIFTYTAAPEKYEEYLPDVEQMLERFSFKD